MFAVFIPARDGVMRRAVFSSRRNKDMNAVLRLTSGEPGLFMIAILNLGMGRHTPLRYMGTHIKGQHVTFFL